jgi:D-psicose/D-tagatose/L-ribulose 3-epimerase
MATLLTGEVSPISESANIRTAARDKIRSDLNIANALGAETVVGPIHSAHKLFPGRGPTQQEFDYCVEFRHGSKTGMVQFQYA